MKAPFCISECKVTLFSRNVKAFALFFLLLGSTRVCVGVLLEKNWKELETICSNN